MAYKKKKKKRKERKKSYFFHWFFGISICLVLLVIFSIHSVKASVGPLRCAYYTKLFLSLVGAVFYVVIFTRLFSYVKKRDLFERLVFVPLQVFLIAFGLYFFSLNTIAEIRDFPLSLSDRYCSLEGVCTEMTIVETESFEYCRFIIGNTEFHVPEAYSDIVSYGNYYVIDYLPNSSSVVQINAGPNSWR